MKIKHFQKNTLFSSFSKRNHKWTQHWRKHCFTLIGLVWMSQRFFAHVIVLFLNPIPQLTEHWLQGSIIHFSCFEYFILEVCFNCRTSCFRGLMKFIILIVSISCISIFCVEFVEFCGRTCARILSVRHGGVSWHGSWSCGRGWFWHSLSGSAISWPWSETHNTVRLRSASSPHVTGHNCQGPIHHLEQTWYI